MSDALRTLRRRPPGRWTWQRVLAVAAWLAWLPATPAGAEIYRYQDADGNWQFTDRPPPGQGSAPLQEAYAQPQQDRNLATRLEQAFHPRTPIERATLAVVGIKHPLGSGSGFFITDQGHLLTNRHVVRPAEFGDWQQAGDRLTTEAAELRSAADQLRDAERQLAALEEDLRDARQRLQELPEGQREVLQAQVDRLAESHRFRKARVDDARAALTKRERELRQRQRDHSWQSTASSVQNSFTVTLKDGSELTAMLVSVSKDLDLALLKLDGYRTPTLAPAAERWLGQGEVVFAVGSPLGMSDAMTAGVITTVRAGQIVTDAQLMPGNSGGPLLNQNGEVIGVNVAKLTEGDVMNTRGFGMAIPITDALLAFPELGVAPAAAAP